MPTYRGARRLNEGEMKDIAIGCISAILGLVFGIVLTFGVMSLLPKGNSPATSEPLLSASRADASVTVSASYLNAQLQQVVKQTGLAKQATLTLVAPNIAQVAVTVDTKFLGQTISGNATARMRVSVQNARVLLAVEKLDVSGIGISQSLVSPIIEQLRAQAEDQVNKMIQRELQGTDVRLSNIRVTPNEVSAELVSQ
jgi:hypothetical protein